jgi:two-component system sensor histidine kinase BaeS
MTALAVFILIVCIILFWGYNRSIAEWNQEKQSGIEEYVRAVITAESPESIDYSIPADIPLFVYDADRNLLFSNRGLGRKRQMESYGQELTPVVQGGKIAGYYYSGVLNFRNDRANDQFLDSMGRIIWAGFFISFMIALLFALFFSRSLSSPAETVARGLDRIACGDLNINIPEKGAEEIALIARSANKLGRQLESEQELRRQWAQDLAHDLRTPVAALRAQFEGMRDGVLDLTEARIENNIKEIDRIEKLVADLEELTRLESPEMKLEKREIKSGDFIGEIRERFLQKIEEKRIAFEGLAAVDSFRADENLLVRAVSNIMANAVRHADSEGLVRLEIDKDETDKTVITVFNSGAAIPEEEVNRVFDRLFRGEYARNTPGSGLGLTIARKITELHGGTIAIRSRKDYGTTVVLTLL